MMSLIEHARVYIDEQRLGKESRYQFDCSINTFSVCLGRPATLADITVESLAAFVAWLKDETDLKPASINARRSYLITLWGWAATKGLVKEGPPKIRGRRKQAEPEAIDGSLFVLFDLYKSRRLMGRSKLGMHQHLVALRHFHRMLGHVPTLADLNDENLCGFLSYMSDGRSPVTANKTATKLMAQWRFYCKRGLLTVWPDLVKLPEPEKIPKALRTQQLQSLLQACRQCRRKLCGIPAADW